MDLFFLVPPELTPLRLTFLLLILSASGVMSGLSGFGFSAIGALSLALLPPTTAIPLLMALSTANQLLSLRQLRADMKPLRAWWRAGPAPYLLGGMIGVPAGLWMLYHLPGVTLTVAFGAFLCLYALYSIFKPDTLALTVSPGPAAAVGVGALGGVIGGFTAFPGAVVVVWAGLTRLSKADTRAVVQPYILGMQLLSLTVLAVTQPSTFGPSFWQLGVLALPFVLGCTLMGLRLYRQLSDFNFRRVTFLLLGSSGLGILIKSLPAVELR